MKKFLYAVLFLFVVLIACSKEEEPTPPPTPKFTVSFSASEGGSVSTEGGSYDQGTKVTVTATPDGEFLFDRWSDGNTNNPREITVTSNLSLTANFVKKKYALTVNIEGEGTVQEEVIVQGSTSTTEYNSGTSVRLTATPSDEWVFSGWSGSVESTDNPIEVSVDEAKEITATFKLKQYNLTINVEGEGTVSETIITQPTLYDSGTVVKLEATPSDGWQFIGWKGDIESTENPVEVSIAQDLNLIASFEKLFYTVKLVPVKNLPSSLKGYNWGIQVAHSFQYFQEDKEFFLGGGVNWNDPNEFLPPLFRLERKENHWEVANIYDNVEMNEIRNHEFLPNGEGVLIMETGPEWPNKEWPYSNVYLGKFEGYEINWTRVSQNPSFYHDASFGDLNRDGIMDIVGGHLGARHENPDNPHLFLGNSNGTFEEIYNVFPDDPDGGCCGDLEIYDIDKDGYDDLIRIGGYWEREILDVLTYNTDTSNYDIIYTLDESIPENYVTDEYYSLKNNTNSSSGYHGYMPKNKRFHDFNNDGYIDFINEKNGLTIWLGDGNMNYTPFRLNTGDMVDPEDYGMSGQSYFDIENDGDIDIVKRSFTIGNPTTGRTGISIEKQIYINDNGNFKRLNTGNYFVPDELFKENYPGSMFIPFIRSGKLGFMGATHENIDGELIEVMLEILTDIDASLWYSNE